MWVGLCELAHIPMQKHVTKLAWPHINVGLGKPSTIIIGIELGLSNWSTNTVRHDPHLALIVNLLYIYIYFTDIKNLINYFSLLFYLYELIVNFLKQISFFDKILNK